MNIQRFVPLAAKAVIMLKITSKKVFQPFSKQYIYQPNIASKSYIYMFEVTHVEICILFPFVLPMAQFFNVHKSRILWKMWSRVIRGIRFQMFYQI